MVLNHRCRGQSKLPSRWLPAPNCELPRARWLASCCAAAHKAHHQIGIHAFTRQRDNARPHIEPCAHVLRLLLAPDDISWMDTITTRHILVELHLLQDQIEWK